MASTKTYIKQELIDGFKLKIGPFNYEKLVDLLASLNRNYAKGDARVSSMLIRAILDHIPPLLAKPNFDEVANNYPWTASNKKYMLGLFEFKNEGDDVLHTQISDKKDYLEIENLPNSNRMNILLQECLINGGAKLPQKTEPDSKAEKSKINVEIVEGEFVRWANFAVGHYLWSSFRVVLSIDNYASTRPDYITVALKARNSDGEWVALHFIFEDTKEHRTHPDEAYAVAPYEVKKVPVFISSDTPSVSNANGPMPDIDRDTLELTIKTKSGKTFAVPIKQALIATG